MDDGQRQLWQSRGMLLLAAVLIVGGIIVTESVVALAVLLMEGLAALAVIASAGLAGGWIVQLLGLGAEPWRNRLVVGAGLGVGLLSLMVLGLGAAGILNKTTAFALVAILAVAGLVRLVLDIRKGAHIKHAHVPMDIGIGMPQELDSPIESGNDVKCVPTDGLKGFHWFWLVLCPFLAIAILAACLPPGILWAEEANGYDVLEYHLAVPKTFYQAGQITFLANNVYSNFPLAYEMLALLMMHLRGDAVEASFMAVMANVALGCLLVAAAWLVGRKYSPMAGVMTGLLAGSLPWIAYLAGIAFVEVGMLALGMCGLAAIICAGGSKDRSGRWLLVAGILVGLSCGYKYTAIPLIALPFSILPFCTSLAVQKRVKGFVLFGLGAVIMFLPWMIRNVTNTGNPVFPLAYSVFDATEEVWDAELEARWQHAHSAEAVRQSNVCMGISALRRTVGDYRMGVLLFVLAAVGAIINRDRWTMGLLIVFIWQLVVWVSATHLFARFAVVMLMPMIVLAGQLFGRLRSVAAIRLMWVVLIVGGGWNLYQIGSLYYHHTRHEGRPINAYGRTDWFVKEHPLNTLGRDARVMMVGDARSFYVKVPCEYAVVFNRHPLTDAIRSLPDAKAVIQWLGRRSITHIFVHWGEMDRLAGTYGYDSRINADLFARLEAEGLKESESFSIPETGRVYATLYELSSDE
ncbi:MAG: hypothetical protein JSV03_11860 [Planctomycetota bacterium]|nr:MAG: hypothetical protein JSV03_11860 [Planctomycetota bacterium]